MPDPVSPEGAFCSAGRGVRGPLRAQKAGTLVNTDSGRDVSLRHDWEAMSFQRIKYKREGTTFVTGRNDLVKAAFAVSPPALAS